MPEKRGKTASKQPMYELQATGDALMMTVQEAAAVGQQSVTLSPEALLVRAVLEGDRNEYGRLYSLYAPLVHGILLARMPRSEVEDMVQEIFLHALRKLHTLRDANSFGPWVAMIARNRAMDFHRKTRATEEVTEEMQGADGGESRAAEILEIIRTLPDAYRETLVLRLVEGMTGPEIAMRTGLTPASVRVNLHRGMKLLREKLGFQEGL
jgi:RNA polymerase sigma-70 factor (ECF subfamily)